MLRKFDSGVMVIQNKSHSDEEVILFYFYHLSCCSNYGLVAIYHPCLLVGRSSLHNWKLGFLS